MKSSYRRPVVSTANGKKSIGSGLFQVDVSIMPNFNPDRMVYFFVFFVFEKRGSFLYADR